MRVAVLIPLLMIAACTGDEGDVPFGGQMVGGPCSYDTSVIEAEVVRVEDNLVELSGPARDENFVMPIEDFGTAPEAGTEFTIRREMITRGTCTPEIYTIIG